MHRVFFRFLLWLLIAALPLQGFASSMHACCVEDAVVAPVATAQVSHCHDMAEPAAAKADMGMHHGHDCSNHGACTAGATAPPAMLALQPLSLSGAPVPLAGSLLFSGHIPSGLERPPRLVRSA
ncbi:MULTISPECIES: hypothetical protein [unclassified Janthinobacterium]|uniref:hypothetical protein n=1 Tax=unclassified Janthinobacterium TaxID=2610881 RepID=UPI0016084DA2|nr:MULTISPECIES: hypothetical protein [unclassified Janthinobacterium]MBB5368852.1 hypothetical protein [Janthinobacterium sp. K2C7]MBB5381612.1 hypothetical protein [Janthinobacterium sp. K2Li3]MBB5387234.1 hypothetical protein [Janthinobacterium sp. K2E3]